MRWFRFLSIVLALSGAAAFGASNADAVQSAQEELTQAFPQVDFHTQGDQVTSVYGTVFGVGMSPEDTAATFVSGSAEVFGVSADALEPGNWFNDRLVQPVMPDRVHGGYKFTLVYYRQHVDGVPVHGAELRVLVRNEAGYPLVLARSSLQPVGDFTLPAGAAQNPDVAAARAAAVQAYPGLVNFGEEQAVIVHPGMSAAISGPTLAIMFEANNGLVATPEYEKYRFFADATTGEILYVEDRILNVDIEGTVAAQVSPDHRADACVFETYHTMPYVRVAAGGSVAYADANGNFVIPYGSTDPVDVSAQVRGLYFNVNNQGGSDASLTIQDVVPPGPIEFEFNTSNQEYTTAEVNVYVEANIIRDTVLVSNPDYPTVASQSDWPANVNLNDTCNAYYDYSSINFFRAGGGCNNTGFGDVVHHEYGHHLVATGGSGQGQYGEGMSDSAALIVTGRSELGIGFQNCSSGIRDADNTMQYPCSGAIHYCGQLLSGCVWDLREQLQISDPIGYNQTLADLTFNSILLHSGDLITPQITIDFLTLDDDDGDIGNGTPHYAEIDAAFSPHNMAPPPLSLLSFVYSDGLPAQVSPAGGTTVQVEVVGVAASPEPNTGMFHYDIGDGWVSEPMTALGDDVYEATFPASTCGQNVQFYFSAETTTGQLVTDPDDAPTAAHSAISAYGLEIAFEDTFNSHTGWTVQNGGGLTDGQWQRGIPAGGGDRGDPPTDYDGSGYCYVTDNADGNSDVDDGYTRLISPTIDLSDGDAQVTYALWYTNFEGDNPYSDYFHVHVSDNNGSSWVLAQTFGPSSAAGWTEHSFVVGDYVTPTSTVKVRFEASDLGGGSIVEAAVDGFRVEQVDCEAPYVPGDMDCSGAVDFDDIDPFVLAISGQAAYEVAYPDCEWLNGDINGDNTVDFDDINGFVSLIGG